MNGHLNMCVTTTGTSTSCCNSRVVCRVTAGLVLLTMFSAAFLGASSVKNRPLIHKARLAAVLLPTTSSSLKGACAIRAKTIRGFAEAKDSLAETDSSGKFVRTPSLFRNKISREEGARFPPAKGRYHLYISHGCPWANRCHAAIRMKRLEKVIGMSVVHPTWQETAPGKDKHIGWTFRDPDDAPVVPVSGVGAIDCKGCVPDTVNGAKTVRELYEIAAVANKASGRGDGDPGPKFSVPVLWDKEEGTIVNNESEEILRMIDSEFSQFEGPGESATPRLYPEDFVSEIEEINSWVYDNINNGVYKCGFAKSQAAYDEAVKNLYKHLDKAEEILSKQRYLCGNRLTEADVRLFMTLVRFDEVYVVYFKCNKKPISAYPHLTNYMRDLFQTPGLGESVDMEHIKRHYFTSHPSLNAYSVIPSGPGVLEDLKQPHNRDTFAHKV